MPWGFNQQSPEHGKGYIGKATGQTSSFQQINYMGNKKLEEEREEGFFLN